MDIEIHTSDDVAKAAPRKQKLIFFISHDLGFQLLNEIMMHTNERLVLMWIRSNLRPKMKLSSSFLLTSLVSEHKEEVSRECFRLSNCQTVRCLAMRTKVDQGIRIEATSVKFQFVQGCSSNKMLLRK